MPQSPVTSDGVVRTSVCIEEEAAAVVWDSYL